MMKSPILGRPHIVLFAMAAVGLIPITASFARTGRTLSRSETASIHGGGEANKQCGDITSCAESDECTNASQASCSKKSLTSLVKNANKQACNQNAPGLTCMEMTPNIDCARVFSCQWNNADMKCEKVATYSSTIRAPTSCANQ